MKKILLLLTKIVIGIVLLVVLLLVTATILLNTQSVQDDLVARVYPEGEPGGSGG